MSLNPQRKGARETVTAILTDSHFWIPAIVLSLGVALLMYLR
jgi:hypothetical protein